MSRSKVHLDSLPKLFSDIQMFLDPSPVDQVYIMQSESQLSILNPPPLLTDRSFIMTYRLYCQKDKVVTIIVRPADDPSPNSSRCPSAPESLRQRRRGSGDRNLQNIVIRPP